MFTTSSAPAPSTASSSSISSPFLPQTHPPTEILVGRYKLIRPLSRGAFGVVGEYEDLLRQERVAIKAIRPNIVGTEGKRLMREVDLLHFLHGRHPCVISYDCVFVAPGEREGGGSAGVARRCLRRSHWGETQEEEDDDEEGKRSHAEEHGSGTEVFASRAVSSSLWMAPPPGPLWQRLDAVTSSSSTTTSRKAEQRSPIPCPPPPRPSRHAHATPRRCPSRHEGSEEGGGPHSVCCWATAPSRSLVEEEPLGQGGPASVAIPAAASGVPFSTNVYTQRQEAGGGERGMWHAGESRMPSLLYGGAHAGSARFLTPSAEAWIHPKIKNEAEEERRGSGGDGRDPAAQGWWSMTSASTGEGKENAICASPLPVTPFGSNTLLASPPYADPIYALYAIFQSLNTFNPAVYPAHLSPNVKHVLHLKGLHALAAWVFDAQDGGAGVSDAAYHPGLLPSSGSSWVPPPLGSDEDGRAVASNNTTRSPSNGGGVKRYPYYSYNCHSHSNHFYFGLPQLPAPAPPAAPPPSQGGTSSTSGGHGHGEEEGGGSLTESEKSFYIYIVMPYCHGDLMGFIKLIQELPDAFSDASSVGEVAPPSGSHAAALVSSFPPNYFAVSAVVLCFQMVLGLDVLHQYQIVHRDLKPENILVNLQQEDPYRSTALLADFGLARDEEMSETMYVCTRYYRPPELIARYENPGPASDIWSIGCILFEVCTGIVLFQVASSVNDKGLWDGGMASDQLEVVLNVVGTPSPEDIEMHCPAGNPKAYLLACSRRYSQVSQFFYDHFKLHDCTALEKNLWLDLIVRCLAFFPRQRPTAEEVCQHRLFVHYGLHYRSPWSLLPSASSLSPSFFLHEWNAKDEENASEAEGQRNVPPVHEDVSGVEGKVQDDALLPAFPTPSLFSDSPGGERRSGHHAMPRYVPFAQDPMLRRRLSHSTASALKKDLLWIILQGLNALQMEGEALVEKEGERRVEGDDTAGGKVEEEEEEEGRERGGGGGGGGGRGGGDEKRKRERNDERRWRGGGENEGMEEADGRGLAMALGDKDENEDEDESEKSVDELEFRESMKQAAVSAAAAAAVTASASPLPWTTTAAEAASTSAPVRPYRYYYTDASDPPSCKARLSRGVDPGKTSEADVSVLPLSTTAAPLPLYRLAFPPSTSSSFSTTSSDDHAKPLASTMPMIPTTSTFTSTTVASPAPAARLSPVWISVTSSTSSFDPPGEVPRPSSHAVPLPPSDVAAAPPAEEEGIPWICSPFSTTTTASASTTLLLDSPSSSGPSLAYPSKAMSAGLAVVMGASSLPNGSSSLSDGRHWNGEDDHHHHHYHHAENYSHGEGEGGKEKGVVDDGGLSWWTREFTAASCHPPLPHPVVPPERADGGGVSKEEAFTTPSLVVCPEREAEEPPLHDLLDGKDEDEEEEVVFVEEDEEGEEETNDAETGEIKGERGVDHSTGHPTMYAYSTHGQGFHVPSLLNPPPPPPRHIDCRGPPVDKEDDGEEAFTEELPSLQDDDDDDDERPPGYVYSVHEMMDSEQEDDETIGVYDGCSHSAGHHPCMEESPLQTSSSPFHCKWSEENSSPLSAHPPSLEEHGYTASSSSSPLNDAWETESEGEERRHREELASLGVPPSVLQALERRSCTEYQAC